MLFPNSYDPPLPEPPRRTPRLDRGVCWSDLVVAPMVQEFGPITPHPDPEKARLEIERLKSTAAPQHPGDEK